MGDPVKGGIDGEFIGRVYPLVIGLKSGPRPLHLFSEGATVVETDHDFVAAEADGKSRVRIPKDNIAFIAENFFLIDQK